MSEAHIRIDEGVKRGPKKRLAATRLAPLKLIPGHEYHPSKLTGIEPFQIITRYLNGETSEQIAHSLKVTRQGLAYFLRKNAEEDWREAQIVQAIERKDRSEDLLESARDPLSLARAREQLRAAQWDLERLFNRMYGQKQQLTVANEVIPGSDRKLLEDASALLDLVRKRGAQATNAVQQIEQNPAIPGESTQVIESE